MSDPQRQYVLSRVRALQVQLDTLRLSVKIMAHDLESTRRERDHLQSLLPE